ncbi:MAG: ArsR family transcriptional regulator, arsenate/arsenite/antimonite-responsive transcriptional [Frankiales bacterium]|nr:ArsR family transcriptional regulator, arsenate/arsenite/antimonite-responsive transcriptional [Frankiales bacterium]
MTRTATATVAQTASNAEAFGPVAPAMDSATLRLLAEPTRAAIVQLLAVEQLCTCHLVEELNASQTNISNHLRVLRDGGIVTASPCGQFTYYALVPEVLAAVCEQFRHLAAQATQAVQVRRPCG